VLLYAEEHASLPSAWLLTKSTTVVGREAPADVVVPVNAISRVHAQIARERGAWTLTDLGSRNGTLVDGASVDTVRLEHGQEVRFGDAIFKFVESDADRMMPYRIDGSVSEGRRLATEALDLVGGHQLDRIASEVERVARTALSVVLLGESGTGKEVVARALHSTSGRQGDFRAINCAAIPQNLLESELFGYKRGAFSGADRDKPGLVKAAHNGTLLLDEIGDMPMAAQAKLLRVLQSKEVYPVGATAPEPVDVRVVCATHRDLKLMQAQGAFREDLYARLNEYQLRLPPLRDRKEDVFMLLKTFLKRHGRPDLGVSFRFMTALLQYDWPYNVRELEACAKRSMALGSGPELDADVLPEPIRDAMSDYGSASSEPSGGGSEGGAARRGPPSDAELRELLSVHDGNVAAVGRALGKARMQIHRWIERYEIDLADFR
jgi:transcriptional regulator with PAS, ATPase and Fis domain